jgi:hypothetical protein
MQLRDILETKEEGNDHFKRGDLIAACVKYACALEMLMNIEIDRNSMPVAERTCVDELKANLFLNIAIANHKMNKVEESRRCCNVVLVFCQRPHLPLSELGINDDLNFDVELKDPISLPIFKKFAAKALYRRGLCRSRSDRSGALMDFEVACVYEPHDKVSISLSIVCFK